MTVKPTKRDALRAVSLHQRRDDPHGDRQYADDRDIAYRDAYLQVFAFAAYGGLSRQTPGVGTDIGAGYQTVTFDASTVTPRGITIDVANNTLAFENDGVYAASLSIGFEHDSSNQGRTTTLRFYDETDGAPFSVPVVVPTGRNAEATIYSLTLLIEITEALKGHVFRLEIGGGDTYTLVDWDVSEWSAWNVGEWREPLQAP